MESYDFSGKTLVPFATSGGSGMGRTVEEQKKTDPEFAERFQHFAFDEVVDEENQKLDATTRYLAILSTLIGCNPDVGDLCLYAPLGNLSVFYQDFRYSNSLILLGHIDSGMDVISGMNGDFSATLEAVD